MSNTELPEIELTDEQLTDIAGGYEREQRHFHEREDHDHRDSWDDDDHRRGNHWHCRGHWVRDRHHHQVWQWDF